MKIKEIGIGISRTFNLGNFESLRVEATVAASIEDVGETEEARLVLLAEIRETLRQAYGEFRPKKKDGQLDV